MDGVIIALLLRASMAFATSPIFSHGAIYSGDAGLVVMMLARFFGKWLFDHLQKPVII